MLLGASSFVMTSKDRALATRFLSNTAVLIREFSQLKRAQTDRSIPGAGFLFQ